MDNLKGSIIVVEGKQDVAKIKSIYQDVEVVSVSGNAINSSTIDYLKQAQTNHQIIIFTDPDQAGNKIRNSITKQLSNPTQAFISAYKAKDDKTGKIGIEYVSGADIIYALSKLVIPTTLKGNLILKDLLELDLTGPNSTNIRQQVANILNIGQTNAKTFLKRINTLKITKEDLINVIKSCC